MARAALPWGLLQAGLAAFAEWGPDAPMAGFVLAFGAAATACAMMAFSAAAWAPGRRLVLPAALVVIALVALLLRLDLVPHAYALLQGWVLLFGGALIGAALGREVVDRAHLWPLVIVAAAADLWSVTAPSGLTRAIVEGRAPVSLSAVVLHVPVGPGEVAPVLGVGDVLLTAFLVGAAARVSLPPRRTALGLGAGFLLCLGALAAIQAPVPALPFVALAFAAAHGGALRPRPRELGAALAVAGALFALGALALRAA